jgi:hypothetical protein
MDEELRSVIIRIDERTKNMAEAQEKQNTLVDKRLDAHAGKIRALENWRWLIVGMGTLAGAILKLSK